MEGETEGERTDKGHHHVWRAQLGWGRQTEAPDRSIVCSRSEREALVSSHQEGSKKRGTVNQS